MILILGGEGVLGSAIARLLRESNIPVTAVGREECDIRQADQVISVIAKHQPEVVVNCAAMTNVDYCESMPGVALHVNGSSVGTVALASAAAGATLIHISTDYVFSGGEGPYLDTDIPRPINYYGVSKYFGEQAVRRYGRNYVIVRLGWLYGPEYPSSAPELARSAATRPVAIWDDVSGTPTLMEVAAHRLAIAAGIGTVADYPDSIVHLGPIMEPVTWYEFLVKDNPNISRGKTPFGTTRPRNGGLIPTKGWEVVG